MRRLGFAGPKAYPHNKPTGLVDDLIRGRNKTALVLIHLVSWDQSCAFSCRFTYLSVVTVGVWSGLNTFAAQGRHINVGFLARTGRSPISSHCRRGPEFPVNTKHLYNICTISGQRRRRWADVVQMLYKCFVFVENGCTKFKCKILRAGIGSRKKGYLIYYIYIYIYINKCSDIYNKQYEIQFRRCGIFTSWRWLSV